MRPEPLPPAGTRRRTVADDTRTYRFLTYVMGGGVQVKDHVKLRDEVTQVRAASIRGHLRFWWRVCNPSGCATVEELRLDLRAVLQRCRPDWDISTPEHRAAWDKGDKAKFFPYGKTQAQVIAEED